MIPTSQQQEAIDAALTGANLVIEAGAGTGKTATLALIAQAMATTSKPPKRWRRRKPQMLYVAFNKAIVTESRGKLEPYGVKCSTAHSLAYQAVARPYLPRLGFPGKPKPQPLRAGQIAARLGIRQAWQCEVGGKKVTLQTPRLARLVMRAVEEFCKSAEERPTKRFIERVEGIDPPKDGKRTYANNDALRNHLAPFLDVAWDDIMSTSGVLPFTHQSYLKLWQLSKPVLNADVILWDEAQDASPVMLDVVRRQTCQVIAVGDSQQAIYGFTGATNALDPASGFPAERRVFLSQSFRFGQGVADAANYVLEMIPGAELRLTGNPDLDSTVGAVASPDAVLCRTNAGAVSCALNLIKAGKRVALSNADDVVRFAKGAQELMGTYDDDGNHIPGSTEHPDLFAFSSWDEVHQFIEEGEGEDLALLVKLVDDFGVDTILSGLASTVNERTADVTVTTAHKSKGRQWPAVVMYSDFPDPLKRHVTDEELRLAYVAVTRAERVLDIDRVPLLRDFGLDCDAGHTGAPEEAPATPPEAQEEAPGGPRSPSGAVPAGSSPIRIALPAGTPLYLAPSGSGWAVTVEDPDGPVLVQNPTPAAALNAADAMVGRQAWEAWEPYRGASGHMKAITT